MGGDGGRLGFNGELSDSVTGLVHLRARDYAPSTGRFTSRDSLFPAGGGTQGYQRYAYANTNPATMVDPSGHMAYRSGNLEETIAWAQANFGGVAGAFLTLALVFNCILFGDCVIPEAAREHTVTWSARSLLFAGGGFPVLPSAHGVNASVFDNPFGGGGRGAGRLRTGSLGGIWNAVKGGVLGVIAFAFEMTFAAPPLTTSTVVAEPVPTPVTRPTATATPVSTAQSGDPVLPPQSTATATPSSGCSFTGVLPDRSLKRLENHIVPSHGISSPARGIPRDGRFFSDSPDVIWDVISMAANLRVQQGKPWRLSQPHGCAVDIDAYPQQVGYDNPPLNGGRRTSCIRIVIRNSSLGELWTSFPIHCGDLKS